MRTLKPLFLAGAGLLAVCLVLITSYRSSLRAHIQTAKAAVGLGGSEKGTLASTVAFIRYNNERLERRISLDHYAPFFHTIHHSMPRRHEGHDVAYHADQITLTDDNYARSPTTYRAVADLMQKILSEHDDVTGILYYHFDAWIDPQGFANMNYSNIWWPSRKVLSGPSGLAYRDSGPFFGCYIYDEEAKNEAQEWPFSWWFFRENAHKDTMDAHNDVVRDTQFALEPQEFCTGWSDMYYIPRRFFRDFILLTDLYDRRAAFHESVIPTMITLIDRLHRSGTEATVIDFITDCWGDCCSNNPSISDIIQHRCGHRMDWLNVETSHKVLSRLEEQKAVLGTR